MSVTQSRSGSLREKSRSHEIAGGRLGGDAAIPRAPGDALEAGLAHQQPHRFGTDGDAVAQRELGVNPAVAVQAAEVDVDPADHLGEHAWRSARSEGARMRQA
jgi:hypothetical protein